MPKEEVKPGFEAQFLTDYRPAHVSATELYMISYVMKFLLHIWNWASLMVVFVGKGISGNDLGKYLYSCRPLCLEGP